MALVAKQGEAFPAFFYRQAYTGALNSVHLVPALFLFGPSIWLLRLNAIAWYVLFPWLLYVLGRRLSDEPTARVALLLAVPPPFLPCARGARRAAAALRPRARDQGRVRPRGADRLSRRARDMHVAVRFNG